MGVYLKNKPSTVNYIVSNSILQFLLMGVFSIWLLFPKVLDSLSYPDTGLVEMREDVGDEEIDQILILLNQQQWIDKLTIKHISKEEAISIMENDIDGAMIDRVKKDNPFRDVLTFSTSSETNLANNFESLREKSLAVSGISGVYNLAGATSDQSFAASNWSMFFSIPLVILLATLGFLFLNSSLQTLIESNSKMIRSLITYGSEPSFINSIFKKLVLKETLVGWIIGLVLFILAFYLMMSAINVGFSDISIKLMVVTVLLPLLLMIIFISISVNKKISYSLKSYS